MVVAAATVGALVLAVLVTSVTGLPGPAPLRRYPVHALAEVVAAVHDDAGELRTPDDCWRGRHGRDPGPAREVARIDHLGSRVVVRAWAGDDGVADPATRRRIERRIDALIEERPHLEREMVRIESSVDGWRPELDCRRPVTEF